MNRKMEPQFKALVKIRELVKLLEAPELKWLIRRLSEVEYPKALKAWDAKEAYGQEKVEAEWDAAAGSG